MKTDLGNGITLEEATKLDTAEDRESARARAVAFVNEIFDNKWQYLISAVHPDGNVETDSIVSPAGLGVLTNATVTMYRSIGQMTDEADRRSTAAVPVED